MNKGEISQIKKLYRKDHQISKIVGRYYDADKKVVSEFTQSFGNMSEEEQFKYLDLLKKSMSGGVGKAINTYDVIDEESKKGLMYIAKEQLKPSSTDVIYTYFDKMIDTYSEVGNFLLLAFASTYDIPARSDGGEKLLESEDVYEYVHFLFCPVSLEKAGLMYSDVDETIVNKDMRWIVDAPKMGFLYPSLEDFHPDYDKITIFVKGGKPDFDSIIEMVLGCEAKASFDEQKTMLEDLISTAITSSSLDDKIKMTTQIVSLMNDTIKEDNATILNLKDVKQIIKSRGVDEDIINKSVEKITPVDRFSSAIVDSDIQIKSNDFSVKVKSSEEMRIRHEVIDGKKYILVEVKDEEPLEINGVVIS